MTSRGAPARLLLRSAWAGPALALLLALAAPALPQGVPANPPAATTPGAPAAAPSAAATAPVTAAPGDAAPGDPASARDEAAPGAGEGAPPAEAHIPEYAGFVTDAAGVMDEAARAKLEAFLDQLKQKTGAEFAVLTVKSSAPLTPSEFKVRVFERWKIGSKGEDTGLLMLVSLDEREVRFETGYGLEGTLPDGLQSRIVRDVMREPFRAGDYAGGITAGALRCAAIIAAEKGVTLEWDGRELRYTGGRGGLGSRLPLALIVFLVIIALASIASNRGGPFSPRRGYRGGGLGGWGGGFGGFGGGSLGGGGFGGGGLGGGFGGFGGGSSGGGGGGGSW